MAEQNTEHAARSYLDQWRILNAYYRALGLSSETVNMCIEATAPGRRLLALAEHAQVVEQNTVHKSSVTGRR